MPRPSHPVDPPGLVPLAWSEPIRKALIEALPGAELAAAFGAGDEEGAALEALRMELAAEAARDADLRAWLWASWRRAQRSLVDGLARLLAGHGRHELSELLREHGAPTLALAVLSEPGEEPDELVAEALEHLRDAGERKALRGACESWLAPEVDPTVIEGRLIVIGGHPRERLRLEALLGPVARELKWIQAVRGTGRGEAQLGLTAVSPADTVLIVTGRVSHSIMHSARKAADAQGAACHFVERLTEREVERLVEELRARANEG